VVTESSAREESRQRDRVAPDLPDLRELAHAFGVATEYYRQDGEHVVVSRDVIADVLRSLGADPTDEVTIAASLEQRRMRDWRRTLPPVFVTIAGHHRSLWVHLPHGQPVTVDVVCEDGSVRTLPQVDRWVEPRSVDDVLIGEATFAVPADLPLGWHTVRAHLVDRTAESPLVVTPARVDPESLHGKHRMWGFMAQLYSVRSRQSWGIGDLADLTDLATWSAHEGGADFVLINPLHAPAPVTPMSASPYLPATRRFANPMYLRLEQIREYGSLSKSDVGAIRRLAKRVRHLNDELLDRDAAWAAKRAALGIIRSVGLTPGRQSAYDAYVATQGSGLVDAATWMAIAERLGADWRAWPAGLQHPRNAEVARWRTEHADDVERHLWMQWLLDEQLNIAQAEAVRAGMRIGVIHDLAVGSTFDGADAWALQDVLAQGVSVGAPPDMYNQRGQNWAQPPWRPDGLADAAFIPYRDMLRTIMRNAGGVRIDHIMGLFRMWWIPEGRSADQGTYVAFDHEALIGILVLEAHRAGAVVIGEDLGTVEPQVAHVLSERGILGTVISWFERHADGSLRAPEQWRREALASVTVHDLPPTAGYLTGEHVRLRDELNLLSRARADEDASAARERDEWGVLLRERDLLHSDDPVRSDDIDDWVVALHGLLAQSPARLIGIALPDVVGERRAQNQPGTDQEYPNWRIPLGDARGRPVALDELADAPLLRRITSVVAESVD
jgi:4-alpha-glucanotransferase